MTTCTFLCICPLVKVCVVIVGAQHSTCAVCSVWKVHLCGSQDASVSHTEAACLALSTPLCRSETDP